MRPSKSFISLISLLQVETLGDDNCGYNAFVLGLLDLIKRGLFDKRGHVQRKLLSLCNTSALLTSRNWDELKTKVTTLREFQQLIQIQRELAPELRKISSQQIYQNWDDEHAGFLFSEIFEELLRFIGGETATQFFYYAHSYIKRIFDWLKSLPWYEVVCSEGGKQQAGERDVNTVYLSLNDAEQIVCSQYGSENQIFGDSVLLEDHLSIDPGVFKQMLFNLPPKQGQAMSGSLPNAKDIESNLCFMLAQRHIIWRKCYQQSLQALLEMYLVDLWKKESDTTKTFCAELADNEHRIWADHLILSSLGTFFEINVELRTFRQPILCNNICDQLVQDATLPVDELESKKIIVKDDPRHSHYHFQVDDEALLTASLREISALSADQQTRIIQVYQLTKNPMIIELAADKRHFTLLTSSDWLPSLQRGLGRPRNITTTVSSVGTINTTTVSDAQLQSQVMTAADLVLPIEDLRVVCMLRTRQVDNIEIPVAKKEMKSSRVCPIFKRSTHSFEVNFVSQRSVEVILARICREIAGFREHIIFCDTITGNTSLIAAFFIGIMTVLQQSLLIDSPSTQVAPVNQALVNRIFSPLIASLALLAALLEGIYKLSKKNSADSIGILEKKAAEIMQKNNDILGKLVNPQFTPEQEALVVARKRELEKELGKAGASFWARYGFEPPQRIPSSTQQNQESQLFTQGSTPESQQKSTGCADFCSSLCCGGCFPGSAL